MNYKELIAELSFELSLPRREVRRLLRGFSSVLQRYLIAGHDVHVRNLGRFQRGMVAPRGNINGKKARPANVINFKTARSFLDKMRQT